MSEAEGEGAARVPGDADGGSRGDSAARRVSGPEIVGVAGVIAVAAVLRFWALDYGLPHLGSRPDEAPVLRHTALAAQGQFDYDWSVYPHAYVYLHWLWGEAGLALQHWLGAAPSSDYAQVWRDEPARLFPIGRALTACAGVASVALVWAGARRSLGVAAALSGAALLAVWFLHVRDSHALKPDVMMGFWVTMTIVASVPLARRPGIAAGAIAGLCVGAAAASKYNGLIAAAPVCAAAWISASGSGWRRIVPAPLFVAGLCAALSFAATSPFVLLNPSSFSMLHNTLAVTFPGWVGVPEKVGFDVATLQGPEQPAWAARFGVLSTLVYHAGFSLRYGVGIFCTLLAPVAIVWGLRESRWLPRLAAVFVVAWVAVVTFSPVMLARYVTPMLPALALLEGGVLLAAVGRLAPARRSVAAVVGLTLLVAEPLWSSLRFDRLTSLDDTRLRATEWLASNTPPGSRIAVVGTRFWPWGEPLLPQRRHRVDMRGVDRVDPKRADYLLTHDHELYWSSVDPELMRRSARSLEPVADLDPRAGAEGDPLFETDDAFYVPFHGFSGVSAPGPHIRIYRVR